jgi:hypothetical protein
MDSLMLGDWDVVKQSLHDERTKAVLDKETTAMTGVLAKRLGSREHPVAPSSAR